MVEVKIKPLAVPAETKTASGIITPDTAKEKPQKGTIIAIGKRKKDEAMILKKGDRVLYGKHSGTEFKWEGEEYLILRESDVIAII